MKQEPQVFFEELFTLIAERGRNEIDELEGIKSAIVRDFIEIIKVDLEAILSTAQVVEDLCDQEASYDNFQGWFYAQWKAGCPTAMFNFLEEKALQGDASAMHFLDEICAYGSKLKAVVSGLCVSPTVEVNCEKCYFNTVCKQKKE